MSIHERRIAETPIAVFDLETTGLTPGYDRVIEASVVRIDPGGVPTLVFDSLINPNRKVSATEIHGITDDDVRDAPSFQEAAPALIDAMSDCIVGAYNIYFDIRFLDYELSNIGVKHCPPHFCLMYMRPLLGMGKRCKLDVACAEHGIDYQTMHIASSDVLACARLWSFYLEEIEKHKIDTFGELQKLKSYKFLKSFDSPPLPRAQHFKLMNKVKTKPRRQPTKEGAEARSTVQNSGIRAYWEALTTVVADLEITRDELEYIEEVRNASGISNEQLRALHAKVFLAGLSQFANDLWVDENEKVQLAKLHDCLSQLGWAPGS